VPPESVAVLRPVVALGFLLAAALIWRRDVFRSGARSVAAIAVIGGTATAVFQVAYQLSVERVGVPVTVALLYLSPAIVLAAAGPLLREWPTRGRLVFALLSVAGVWLTALNAAGASMRVSVSSIGWGILAAASYSGYSLFGRYAAPRWGSLPTVIYSTLGATALLLVVLPAAGREIVLPSTGATWGLLALFGFLTIALATFLFYDALSRVEAGSVSIACTVEPVVAALLASWLLGQGLRPLGWIGLGVVVVGVAGSYGLAGRPREPAGTLRD
jgi:drug/metabolite transporter (DMT)-like permease